MTTQQSFKHRVRARMQKTGESYTAARANLIPDPAPAHEPRIADERVRERTGRGWSEWFAVLDEWGAADRPHPEIATWIRTEHGVSGWWAQGVTVEYEKARGLRPIGGDRDGTLNVSASKTVAVPVERLFEAFADVESWAPGTPLRERTSQPGRSARYDWGDGSTRVLVTFTAKGDAKSTVAVSHERLPDGEAADRIRAYWRERLAVLKNVLEEDGQHS
ncbi:MAG TPA: DUF4287 domain-containing protein [Solirubrobacteraceae bacterium]|nr:DUF4287 domain-containing protein [Solirubrobacteraceae bacterium]